MLALVVTACGGDEFTSSATGGSGGSALDGGGGAVGGGGASGAGAAGGSGASSGVGGNSGAGGSAASGGKGGVGGAGGVGPDAGVFPKPLLALWLAADVGVEASTGSVSAWKDQSPAGNNAVQGSVVQRPTLVDKLQNGLPGVVFGQSKFLTLPAGFADFTQGLSLFVVAKADNSTACAPLLHLSNGPEVNDVSLQRDNNNALLYEVDALTTVGVQGDYPAGETRLISLVHRVDEHVRFSVDGAGLVQGQMALPGNVARKQNFVGKSLYSSCTQHVGPIFEILLYRRALGDAERQQVEDYLRSKWKP